MESTMKTDIVTVAYLDKVRTKKDGKSTIRSRPLSEVLAEQSEMGKPEDKVFEDEKAAQSYKCSKPGFFPVVLDYGGTVDYTDGIFRHGAAIFIDIDTTVLVDDVYRRSDELKAIMPSLVAVWYSLRNKLHFAFLCPWSGTIEYAAYWKLVSDELISCVKVMFGNEVAAIWSKKNDRNLSTCMHLMSAGYTKGFKWYSEATFFESKLEAKQAAIKSYEYRRIPSVRPEAYSLFTDKEVAYRWKNCNFVKNFVKWCEKNRDYRYHTQDKQYDYKVEVVDGVAYYVWRNDGTVHKIKEYDGNFKLLDYRKRHIASAAIMAVCYCNATFEEALYSASKYYVENCNEYPAVDDEKKIILDRVESACANKERNLRMCESTGYLLEKRQMVIGDKYADDSGEFCSWSDVHEVRKTVKKSDRHKRFRELYEEGDTTLIMQQKMRENGYPNISETVTYKVGRECGIILDKPVTEHKKKYHGLYKNAYDREGKRTMVLLEKIDNVNLFASKKALDDFNQKQYMEALKRWEEESKHGWDEILKDFE